MNSKKITFTRREICAQGSAGQGALNGAHKEAENCSQGGENLLPRSGERQGDPRGERGGIAPTTGLNLLTRRRKRERGGGIRAPASAKAATRHSASSSEVALRASERAAGRAHSRGWHSQHETLRGTKWVLCSVKAPKLNPKRQKTSALQRHSP